MRKLAGMLLLLFLLMPLAAQAEDEVYRIVDGQGNEITQYLGEAGDEYIAHDNSIM